jgi:hypothetical protein
MDTPFKLIISVWHSDADRQEESIPLAWIAEAENHKVNPEYMDVLNKYQQDKHTGDITLPSLALDTRLPAGVKSKILDFNI